jgi:hypothetical protein
MSETKFHTHTEPVFVLHVLKESKSVREMPVFFSKIQFHRKHSVNVIQNNRGVNCTQVLRALTAAFIESLVSASLRQFELFHYSVTAVSFLPDVIMFRGLTVYAVFSQAAKLSFVLFHENKQNGTG